MLGKLTGAFAAAVIVATAVFWLVAEIDRRNAPGIVVSAPPANGQIIVEIAGAVAMPGVFSLRAGDRVVDLVAAAGGLLPNADTRSLNQAALLIDGQRVTVPFAVTETPERERPDATASPAPLLIDINTATIEDLDRLPGIGEVRAAAIVDYRNRYGPFQSVEELLFVDGISEGVLDEIRPFVTVGA